MKKVLVLVLSVLLICSALPVTVFAESEEKCGDNLVWSIDSETETLTISGSGDMYDYGSRNEPRRAPWISYDGDIKHIVISEGVTSVGNDSFFTLYPETVSLPGTLVRIGEYSFACSGLIKLKIPASVEVIEEGAFDSSDSLTEVCFETGRLKSIGKYAFGHCLKLETIILPQSDVEIGYGAFYKTAVKTLDIPKGITAIGKSAFKSCEALTRVTLPEGLTEIEDGAFSFCSSLASIEFPDTLSVISDQAFACCSLLTTVKFPDSIISIGEEAFTLTSLIEAVFGKNIKKIGANAFYGTNLSAVFLPPSAEQTYGAFANSAGRVITVYGVPGSMAEYTGRDNFIPLNLPAGRDAQDADVCLRGIGHGIVVNFAAVQDDAAAAFRGRKADRRRLAGVVMDARAVVHGEVGVMQKENIAAGRNGIADLGARIQRQLAGRAVADDIAGERRAVLGSPALRAAVNADILERQVTGGVHPEHVAALVALGTRDHRIRILAQIPDLRITDGDHARDINDLVGRIRQQLLGAGERLDAVVGCHTGLAVVAVFAVEIDIVQLGFRPCGIDRHISLDALITVEELRAGLVRIPAVEDVVVLRRVLRVRDILAMIDLRRIVDLAVDDIGHGIDIGLPLAVERQVRRDRRGEVIDLRVGGVRVPVRHMGADAAGLRHSIEEMVSGL